MKKIIWKSQRNRLRLEAEKIVRRFERRGYTLLPEVIREQTIGTITDILNEGWMEAEDYAIDQMEIKEDEDGETKRKKDTA